ncbi:HNH endonuclease [Arthrobacter sp. MPF02]|uniref:HNH endonuclease n=1 Tax=Arthrobacter sp. MPF02 TaxID=3388492 RepID=UPI0039852E90
MGFYSAHPTASTAWRLAVLMGANARTYKFALAHALIEHASRGQTSATLRSIATSYTSAIVQHSLDGPQAPASLDLAPKDFLSLVKKFVEESPEAALPSEELVDAAARSMPGMVMQKFHNLRGGAETPDRFYSLRPSGPDAVVEFTPALMSIASSSEVHSLGSELTARWRIVEASFASGIGQSLMTQGLGVDRGLEHLLEKRRRRPVAGVGAAIVGFQYGRCLICWEPLTQSDSVAIDHVFPFSLMTSARTLLSPQLDLDAVWNLAPAHASCNGQKSNRPPTRVEIFRLGQRNEAIMLSPHPLRRTLELSLALGGYRAGEGSWHKFLASVL